MKCLFVFSKGNFEILLQSLPESNSVTYFFFSEAKLFSEALKKKKPDALLFDCIELDDEILNSIKVLNHKVPLILYGNEGNFPKTIGFQTYLLPYKFTEAQFLKLLVEIGLVGHVKDSATAKKENLFESQLFLDLLMDNVPDTIYFKDRESRFVKINHAQAVTLGVDAPEDAIGKRDEDFFDKEQSTQAFEDEQSLMANGTPLVNKLEYLVTPKGGKYVRATKVPLQDDNGVCIGMVGISRDVSKEYELERNLRKEKRFMDLLMDNLPDRIYFKDRKSQFIRCNMALANMFGLDSPEEMYGKTDMDFFDSIHAKEAFEDEQRIMKAGDSIFDKLESYTKNDEKIWELTTKIPFVNSKDEVIGIVGISHDFTKQKVLEDKLAKEKEILQMLMDNVPDYIYFKDINSKYIRVNRAIATFFKTSVEDMIGTSDSDYLNKETANKIHKQDLAILQEGKELVNRIESIQDLEGNTIWLSTTKVPVMDENSKIVGLVGISRDVTLQEQTKRRYAAAKIKAEEANKAKSLFLANMSHEIRTPMNGIIGMADILSKTSLDSTQKDYLDIIMKSGQTLLALINNILDFSKIESGKMDLETVPISIRSVVEEVADLHAVQASAKSIDLLTYVDPDVPEFVGGDYVRLKQIITNLVNNAIKFTPKGDVVIHIDYLGEVSGGHDIQFKVKDSGIGITKEDQNKLFKSFSQVDSSTTRKYGGTGLGLAISKRLVTLMGGKLEIESLPGIGSTFFFKSTFTKSKEIENRSIYLSKEKLKDKHIVIVDDNETNRLIFRNYLKTWQVKVSEFNNGMDALSFFKEQAVSKKHIDLVLLDYHMPSMNGKELAKNIKSTPETKHLKLVLLSSITDALSSKELTNIGFETGLNKPIKMNQLLNVILGVLGMPLEKKEETVEETESFKKEFVNKRFLIVEDNLVNVKVAHIAIKELSSHVEFAYNGQEAVDLFKKQAFDFILMDIRMPVMDGIEATVKIRKLESESNTENPVKIIATTANTFQEDVESCIDNGMDAFLEKPFKRKELVNILHRLL
ncbi:PAS domain-containing protein [Flavobacteriaceae bacterium XHP0103]|uniref:PAS domain-containing protein n=1 Tax=Marixanthotalea marina TaxID=2844359 RepID=UPI002989A34A|nr:PAS domain-containing protein [Marixanthotalea marina]MBU3822943.1 PAS domain-containing protein [Marixanthotalea marina]